MKKIFLIIMVLASSIPAFSQKLTFNCYYGESKNYSQPILKGTLEYLKKESGLSEAVKISVQAIVYFSSEDQGLIHSPVEEIFSRYNQNKTEKPQTAVISLDKDEPEGSFKVIVKNIFHPDDLMFYMQAPEPDDGLEYKLDCLIK